MARNEPENWTEEEVQAFFTKLRAKGGTAENTQILIRLLQGKVGEAKEIVAARAKKMNRALLHAAHFCALTCFRNASSKSA